MMELLFCYFNCYYHRQHFITMLLLILYLLLQFVDVQNCNSVQTLYPTSVVQKSKLIYYFTTVLKYQIYENDPRRPTN